MTPDENRWRRLSWVGVVVLAGLIGVLAFYRRPDNTSKDQSSPRVLPLPPAARAVLGPSRVLPKIVPGGLHLVVLAADGSLWGVGYNDHGQAGSSNTWGTRRSTRFEQFRGGTDWVDVAVLGQATLAVRRDGTMWQWGAIAGGLMVDPTRSPMQIGGSSNWVQVVASGHRVLARQSDGTLWSWGGNMQGELGDGTQVPRLTPAPVNTDTDWAHVACGPFANVGLKTDGTMWIWGRIFPKDLSPMTGVSQPAQIGVSMSWVRADAQVDDVIAERRDGSLWRIAFSELRGKTNWTRLPDPPGGIRSWSASALNVTVVNQSGRVWVMGENQYGTLAQRFIRSTETWLRVEGLPGAVAAGNSSIGAGILSAEGELFLWGRRYDDPGQGVVRPVKKSWVPFRDWLASRTPGTAPTAVLMVDRHEIVPWKAMAFVPGQSAGTNQTPFVPR